jgi:hypothetical protein
VQQFGPTFDLGSVPKQDPYFTVAGKE